MNKKTVTALLSTMIFLSCHSNLSKQGNSAKYKINTPSFNADSIYRYNSRQAVSGPHVPNTAQQIIYPPSLQVGDLVVILSPASNIDKDIINGQKERLESWGLRVKIAKHALSKHHDFAGTPTQRLSDLQKALDNPEVKAVFCSRGGYGTVHLMENLNLTKFKESPKWLVGYSDITALHNLLQKEGVASIHGLMGKHLATEPANDPQIQHLHSLLFGETPRYESTRNKLNIPGTASGTLHGGNLSVFYGLRGTPYDFPAEGTILVIEDVGERPYHIERMMFNLQMGGVLERLSGLIVGQFTEYSEDNAIGKTVYKMIRDMVKPYGYPVCFDFPVGHTVQNEPLVLGSNVTLEITGKKATLSFSKPQ